MINDDQDREMRLANFEKQMRLCSKISNFIIEQTRITDRELLELAAKAAGITLEWDGNPEEWIPMYYEGKTYHSWNPLDDDGDALRLAVALGLCILTHATQVEYSKGMGQVGIIVEQSFRNCASTRRAIVRAAAEIGRAMK